LLARVWGAAMVAAAFAAVSLGAELGFADWGPRFR
jgi:hypothetical protein